jgi:dTDP-4-dehydrorhamnose 3,5-epimerase-like enzyme
MPETPLAVFSPVFTRADDRGGLSVVERGPTLPFEARRVYWIHGTRPGVSRGFHAHHRLRQICFCLAGSVRLVLFDGRNEESLVLRPGMGGLALPPLLWHEMHDFSEDCILMVLADAEYDEADYIRDREQFVRHVHSS